jgi:hypothetical protein
MNEVLSIYKRNWQMKEISNSKGHQINLIN